MAGKFSFIATDDRADGAGVYNVPVQLLAAVFNIFIHAFPKFSSV